MDKGNPIILVVGARPNFMKIAPLHAELERRGIGQVLLHTGQHYDKNMSKVFFEDLGMPEPDIYLGIGSGSHASQTANIMLDFEKICIDLEPRMVVVVGDVNSTLACAIVASKLHIPIAHVEAGLRSGDLRMPEEINRLVTDALSDLLFTPSSDADENLLKEGKDPNKIYLVGNIMIDSLFENLGRAEKSNIHEELNLKNRDYGVLTLHRPSNVDDKAVFTGIVAALEEICKELPLVFPLHPRTRINAEKFGLIARLDAVRNITMTEPLGYLDFIALTSNSTIVLTDSGGIQEETTAIGIPCITLRENTERPITVLEGTNRIVGSGTTEIIEAVMEALSKDSKDANVPKYWDGETSTRIADILENWGGYHG